MLESSAALPGGDLPSEIICEGQYPLHLQAWPATVSPALLELHRRSW